MAAIEQIEMDRRHAAIVTDMSTLVEKYRAIFDWDVPDIDQSLANKLILDVMRKSLDEIEKNL